MNDMHDFVSIRNVFLMCICPVIGNEEKNQSCFTKVFKEVVGIMIIS